jgi:putative alpha-1,2-mannosidase
VFPCEEQAKMLGILSLCDAYHTGVGDITVEEIEECIERELARKDYERFLREGYFDRYTHILDVTDACLCVADITKNDLLKERLLKLAACWTNAYAEDGLMSKDSKYYEGDRYTYSFRIQKNMPERVEFAGGKTRFASMLDDFFGFGGESVKQLTYVGAGREIEEKHYHRFEGFNNECDMETPYAYIYADRHDRLCEIVKECVSRSFGFGRSGLPGNNDSGGLSSAFIWNALGIFPVSGSGEFLIGAPQVDLAEIYLSGGNTLKIELHRQNGNQIYVDSVFFNGQRVEGYKIRTKDLMRGGVLQFFMKCSVVTQ